MSRGEGADRRACRGDGGSALGAVLALWRQKYRYHLVSLRLIVPWPLCVPGRGNVGVVVAIALCNCWLTRSRIRQEFAREVR